MQSHPGIPPGRPELVRMVCRPTVAVTDFVPDNRLWRCAHECLVHNDNYARAFRHGKRTAAPVGEGRYRDFVFHEKRTTGSFDFPRRQTLDGQLAGEGMIEAARRVPGGIVDPRKCRRAPQQYHSRKGCPHAIQYSHVLPPFLVNIQQRRSIGKACLHRSALELVRGALGQSHTLRLAAFGQPARLNWRRGENRSGFAAPALESRATVVADGGHDGSTTA